MTTALWILGGVVFVALLTIWPGFRSLIGQLLYGILEVFKHIAG